MSDITIQQKVRSIARSYGPYAAREWILRNLPCGNQQAVAFAALLAMIN